MKNNGGAELQPMLIWAQCLTDALHPTLYYCNFVVLKEQRGQMKIVLVSYRVTHCTLVEEPGLRSTLLNLPGRGWDFACKRLFLFGWYTARTESTLLAVILVPTYWISEK